MTLLWERLDLKVSVKVSLKHSTSEELIRQDRFFFQNEVIFVQSDELDEMDRLTHA